VIASVGKGTPSSFVGRTFPIAGNNPAVRVFNTKTSMISNNVQADPAWEQWEEESRIRSWMGVPLLAGQKSIGVLTADNYIPDSYTAADLKILQTFAGQAAIAIENARLFNENKAAREAAETANRAKNIFLGNMGHELRTPLNSILGFTQILQQQNSDPETDKRLEMIQQSGQHLLALINDILDLSKIETHNLELYPKPLYLPSFLDTIVHIIRNRAEAKDLQLVCETDDFLPTGVLADEMRLRQVLLNLLGNAVKFTDIGQVTLRVKVMQARKSLRPLVSQFRFEVEDTGIGISPDQFGIIFQPFEQVSEFNRRSEGAGLGLVISRQLVQLMGGDIHVESPVASLQPSSTIEGIEKGLGSRFWFEVALPLTGAVVPTDHPKPVIIGYKGKQYHILVVDDIFSSRIIVTDKLRSLGFAVIEAESGQQAIDLAQTTQLDLILLDLWMPHMDGLETLHHLRQWSNLEETPVILMSTNISEQGRAKIRAMSYTDFLSKPLIWPELAPQLEKYLAVAWEYAEVPAEALVPEVEVILPPQADLEALAELVQLGSMVRIEAWAEQLAARDVRYQPWADKISHLARNFEVSRITQLLQQHLNEGAS
jgi:signal transduction histidine kinase/CheY-like chemotaxis protein